MEKIIIPGAYRWSLLCSLSPWPAFMKITQVAEHSIKGSGLIFAACRSCFPYLYWEWRYFYLKHTQTCHLELCISSTFSNFELEISKIVFFKKFTLLFYFLLSFSFHYLNLIFWFLFTFYLFFFNYFIILTVLIPVLFSTILFPLILFIVCFFALQWTHYLCFNIALINVFL